MVIDEVALVKELALLFNILFSIMCGFLVYVTLKMICFIFENKKERERRKEAKQLYTARKRQFENNPEGWKKWRDANYKITDLIEADTYY